MKKALRDRRFSVRKVGEKYIIKTSGALSKEGLEPVMLAKDPKYEILYLILKDGWRYLVFHGSIEHGLTLYTFGSVIIFFGTPFVWSTVLHENYCGWEAVRHDVVPFEIKG